MSEVESVKSVKTPAEENNQQNAKRKKGRVSKDRAREESEAITKGLPKEVEGRRLTRSAAKGVPATPPPPAKKERKTVKTPAAAAPSGNKGRGRPKKGNQTTDESDSHDEAKDVATTEDEPANKSDEGEKDEAPAENSTHEEKEEVANNNAEATKVAQATENGAKEDGVDAAAPSSDVKSDEKDSQSTAATPNEDAAKVSTENSNENPAE